MKSKREFFHNLKELPRVELLTPGSPMCAGCGGLAELRLVLKALGDDHYRGFEPARAAAE